MELNDAIGRSQSVQLLVAVGTLIVEGEGQTLEEWTLIIDEAFDDNEALLLQLTMRCPHFKLFLVHACFVRIGGRAQSVDKDLPLIEWSEEDVRKAGRSLSLFTRKRKTPAAAVDAMRLNYPQLDILFVEVVGFEAFMNVIATYVLRENKAGLAMRVGMGAGLSIFDGITDIFVIITYFNAGLRGQAFALIAMCATSMLGQIVTTLASYGKKSWGFKLKEILICLTLLRPAVDAYRISTNYKDDESTMDPLAEVSTIPSSC